MLETPILSALIVEEQEMTPMNFTRRLSLDPLEILSCFLLTRLLSLHPPVISCHHAGYHLRILHDVKIV